MRIVLNGLELQLPPGVTVARLLELEREPADHVLVEVNGVYLPGERHAEHRLRDGDRVEVILPAFGG